MVPAHQHFEELCALAVTGQISSESMALLDAHVKQCADCRLFLQDVSPFKAHVAPMIAASHVQDCVPPEGIRDRFLARAAEAGIPLAAGPAIVQHEKERVIASKDRARSRFLAGLRETLISKHVLQYAAMAAMCVICGLIGYRMAQLQWISASKPPVMRIVREAPLFPADVQLLANLQERAAEDRARVVALEKELERAKETKQQLTRELMQATAQAASKVEMQQHLKAQAALLESANQRIESISASLEENQKKLATSDAVLIEQQQATVEATNQAAMFHSELERERQSRPVTSEFNNLIAARNLHIVDVYDNTADGKRQGPFGRVFYVEGQSLVFYAYDLPNSHKNVQIAFRVWGEKAGVTSVSYNLGVLRSEDPSQRRWVLRCNDPKVLTRINAVYVEAERPDALRNKPSGPKLMYAYLGDANHP
jgi:hypothetical protein